MPLNREKDVFTIADIPSLDESYAEFATFSKDPLFPVDERWSDRISLWAGDMTTLQIDAIVNAANTSLLGGGGIDGAIHNAAGKQLLQECRGLKGCETGKAKITKGYNLPAKHVIHTVGPIGEKPEALKSCYSSVMDIVRDNKLTTVAFCCISTGIYGYDNGRAAQVALETVRRWLDEHHKDALKIERIIFCVFLSKDDQIYRKLIPLYFPKAQVVPRNDNEQEVEPATSANLVNKNMEQSPLDRTEALKTQVSSSSSNSTTLKVDSTQGDSFTQRNEASDATLGKTSTIHRSVSEESLEKRKAEDAIVETDMPNKRPGGSRRNSTDLESVGDARKQ